MEHAGGETLGVSLRAFGLHRTPSAHFNAMAAFTNLPVDLVIVRHGQSEANMMIEMTKRGDTTAQEAMKHAQRHDSMMRLTDKGREQARMVGAWLRENAPPFDAFYCSQYVRTKETAAEMGLPNASWHAEQTTVAPGRPHCEHSASSESSAVS